MEIEKVETTYRVQLNASEYDFLEVVQDEEGRITIKFLDTRWRTVEETIKMLAEISENLKTLSLK